MTRGWDHFRESPKIEDTDRKAWHNDLRSKLDKVAKKLASISKDKKCVVCQGYSQQFETLADLVNHIKWHRDDAINYWIDNMIRISPEELEARRYFDDAGKPK
jgi:hypothetical protein